ncbi:MAG: shikimate kinase [Zoogloeaceae bacterium]|jgi:shikimate kinase|nr:shikimate kinase [Zoogloeaceae bacterium]
MNRNRDIYLVGLMGSGKTTIGRQIARRLGRDCVDSDHEIVTRTGVGIPTIFEIEGEAGFRRREARIIAEIIQRDRPPIVLATGGGAVLAEENRRLLRAHGWVAYLDVSPRILWARTRHDRNRPLLQTEDPLSCLEALYAARDPLYRESAHFVIRGGETPSHVLAQALLKEFNRQCQPST